jgi:hypothetical protein
MHKRDIRGSGKVDGKPVNPTFVQSINGRSHDQLIWQTIPLRSIV